MRLIIIGCEQAGKTTLSAGIRDWLLETTGSCETSFHDHFLPWNPHGGGIKAEQVESELKLVELGDITLLEGFCRYIIHYHTHPDFYARQDHAVVNWYYGDAVYAPMYYGFGGPGDYGDRAALARRCESELMATAPDTVLVLVKARPEIIRERREREQGLAPYPRDADIDVVLRRFQEEYDGSLIRRRIELDTSDGAPADTLAAFLEQVRPMLTAEDRLRLLAHRQLTT